LTEIRFIFRVVCFFREWDEQKTRRFFTTNRETRGSDTFGNVRWPNENGKHYNILCTEENRLGPKGTRVARIIVRSSVRRLVRERVSVLGTFFKPKRSDGGVACTSRTMSNNLLTGRDRYRTNGTYSRSTQSTNVGERLDEKAIGYFYERKKHDLPGALTKPAGFRSVHGSSSTIIVYS